MRVFAAAVAVLAAVLTASQPAQQPLDRAERAYRANNIGVAALERFDYASAAAEFRKALGIDASIHIARLNLALALHYGGDSAAAAKEALAAAKALPDEPRAWFVAGLASRAAGDDGAAISAFERVLQIDAADAAALTNLGQLYMDAARYPDAIARLTAATEAEPFNATALYNLARALLQGGRAAEGQAAMKRFQALREAPHAITYSAAYLQQGRYGEALVSTGSEPQLVDAATPPVFFADATAQMLAAAVPDGAESVAVADVDGDRDFDLIATGTFGVRLLLRDGAAYKLSPALTSPVHAHGAIAADYDNDGRTDVLAVGATRVALWRQLEGGRFEDVTGRAALDGAAGGRTAAFVDLDHDGDVDFVSAPAAPRKTLDAWRNNGNGTFARFDQSAGLGAAPEGAVAIVPTDFDNRRDIDLLVAGGGGVALLRNLRDGRFQDVAQASGWRPGAYQAIAAGDLNADGRTDFYAGKSDGVGLIYTSDGATAFRAVEGPAGAKDSRAAQFVDYDADGVVDLATLGAGGLRIFRNTGAGWTDVSSEARTPSAPCAPPCALASADLDDDGDIDLIAVDAGRTKIWRNESKGPRALAVGLKAHVSNRSAAGARIEMRAGSLLRRLETSIATPAAAPAGILFGLGRRASADVVRVIWPSGIVQAESVPPAVAGRARLDITELDRKPSSCPYLFTWNGSRFEFVTDFLGGGEIGYWLAPGVRNVPDPEEYVRIRGDQLVERDGRYELRVTNELEEALFVDRLSLVAVTHRVGSEVYPNEGLFAPPFPAHRLIVTRGAQPPDTVVDEHGHDVRALVEQVDRRGPSFALERFRGYARDHYVEMSIPARPTPRLVLLLTAWTDYAFSSDNVAASQAGVSLRPPSLEIADADGRWKTLLKEVGIPVGRPQTVVVDLTDRVPRRAIRLRVRTNMRIYWDRILFDASAGGASRTERIPLGAADLRWRGYSAEVSPDGREPFAYDYARVLLTAPWKLMPGRYTREGDVRELVTATDDRFVVSRPGDEIALSFAALPPPPAGWTRTFLLHADGFSKEMDRNSASPDVAAPLPYHGMTVYPYDPDARPLSAAQRAYLERYNTRVVTRSIPSLTNAGVATAGR